MIVLDLILLTISAIILMIVQVVAIITGILVVPIALLFRITDTSPTIPFKYSKLGLTDGFWYPVHLPKIFWAWDNEEDGMKGDVQGRWWNRDSYSWLSTPYLKMLWWAAIRNPANNFKRITLGCDIRNFVISTIAGQKYVRDDFLNQGFQIVKAKPIGGLGWPWYGLYWVKQYGNSDRAVVIQIGHKIREEHNTATYENELDYYKGFTFEVNLWKDIS